MQTVLFVVFGLCVAICLYAYFGYPVALKLVAGLRARRAVPPAAGLPRISITIPAYNEETSIAGTLDAVLALSYPRELRQILVVSDASTDRTDEIVRGYADRGVELLRLEQRGGKTACENAARTRLTGDVIVNTDASVRIRADALGPLIAAFADPAVGVASGRDVSVARAAETANVGESGYVGYEMWIRDLETKVGSIVGASGCFYAIRRDLHMSLVPEALSRDFAAALIAAEHGFRAVTVNDAVCFVPRIGSLHREYNRKVRTMTRGLETLWYKRHLLNPLKHGAFAWMLLSHKLMRWLVPWALVVGAVSLAGLALTHRWAAALLALGVAGLVAAACGWWWPRQDAIPRIVAFPAYVVSGMVAALAAWRKALSGELNPIWEPTRRNVGQSVTGS